MKRVPRSLALAAADLVAAVVVAARAAASATVTSFYARM
jgi:hypothetical protein